MKSAIQHFGPANVFNFDEIPVQSRDHTDSGSVLPLDVGVNSIVQNGRARRWAQALGDAVFDRGEDDVKFGPADAVCFTQDAWHDDITIKIIKDAWTKSCNLGLNDLRR